MKYVLGLGNNAHKFVTCTKILRVYFDIDLHGINILAI